LFRAEVYEREDPTKPYQLKVFAKDAPAISVVKSLIKVYRNSRDMSNYIKDNLELVQSDGRLADVFFKQKIERSQSPSSRKSVKLVQKIKKLLHT
jgi:hypothetical protein